VIGYPLAHVINRSMHTGVFPDGFKSSLVRPVHKGAGKSRAEAASYGPVSILPALSKVLETLVKADLKRHLAEVGGLPPTQYGFHPGRSCATVVGAAHAGWLASRHPGGREVVGVMGFDLSAAFDTVDKSSLLPKLEAVGVKELVLKWFKDYMIGGRQQVVWRGVRSNVAIVKYGVGQGSILGPLLYLVIVADLPAFLGLGRKGNAMYQMILTSGRVARPGQKWPRN
jgi:hypothetical protein